MTIKANSTMPLFHVYWLICLYQFWTPVIHFLNPWFLYASLFCSFNLMDKLETSPFHCGRDILIVFSYALLHITLKSFYSLHTNGNNNPFLSIWWLSAPHLVSTTRHSNPKKVNSITHTPIQVNRTPIYIISNLHQNLVLSI